MANIDLRDFNRAMKNVNKQINFATAVALTKTAKKVQIVEKKTIQSTFDRPKPFTVNAVYFVPARKNMQPEIYSVVGIKDKARSGTPAAKYLQATVTGGQRGHKKVEGKLRGEGLMPGGYYMVPGKNIKLNKFGNMTKGQIGKALTAKDKGSKFFVSTGMGRTAHLKPGIIQRFKNGKIKSYITFKRSVSYRPMFKFYETATIAAKRLIPGEFTAAYNNAIKTAR